MGSPKVLACITAYEDQEAVEQCLKAIAQQTLPVQTLLVIDNSSQPLILDPLQFSGRFIHRHHPENIGISGSFKAALQLLQQGEVTSGSGEATLGEPISKAYEFLWMFDQDSAPEPNCLEILLETRAELETQSGQAVGIIAPTAFDARTQAVVQGAMFERFRFSGKHPPKGALIYECDAPITSGSLIAIAPSQAAGFPYPELFIDGVDFAYGMALRKQGFSNWICDRARLAHRFGTPITYQFRGQSKPLHLYSPLRHYYMCRNHSYLELRYAQGLQKLLTLLWRCKFMTYTALKIMLFDPTQKQEKILACVVGTFYGLKQHLKAYKSE